MTSHHLVIRPCTTEDLSALEAWDPTGNTRTHERRFGRQLAGTSTYFLATLQGTGELVGSCEVRWDGCAEPSVPREPEINGLQVLPESMQSQGIGTALIRAVEDAARGRGCGSIGLGVHDPRARALYLRLGYQETGTTYTDRYTWVDENHQEHHVADECRWLSRSLADR